MADDDLLEQARALHQRAEAVRTEAAGLRKELREEFRENGTELGLARDRALRAKMTADHAVEDADQRTASLEAAVADTRQALAKGEVALAAATAKGDTSAADEQREFNDGYRDMLAQGDVRLHANKLDSAATREAAGTAERAARETQLAYDDNTAAVTAAEAEIDKIENQADLIEQARMKLVTADLQYGGDPPADADIDKWVTSKATLEVEAEALLKKADAITVDRSVIAVVVPTADDPAASTPLGDDLMDPNDEATDAVPTLTDNAGQATDDDEADDEPGEATAADAPGADAISGADALGLDAASGVDVGVDAVSGADALGLDAISAADVGMDAISGADALQLDPVMPAAATLDPEFDSEPSNAAADLNADGGATTGLEPGTDGFAAGELPDAPDTAPMAWDTADVGTQDTAGWEAVAAEDGPEPLAATDSFSDTDGF